MVKEAHSSSDVDILPQIPPDSSSTPGYSEAYIIDISGAMRGGCTILCRKTIFDQFACLSFLSEDITIEQLK